MATDITLRLETRGPWGFRRRAITVTAPPEQVKTEAGRLEDPPENLWSGTSGYAKGEIDVQRAGGWLTKCIGDPVLNAIRKIYPEEETETDHDHLRTLITATEALRPDLMKVPWELLESLDSARGMPLVEKLSVVRVLEPQSPASEPLLAGDKLKVAVLWANPCENIPNLEKHLSELQRIADNYPGELSLIGPVEFIGAEVVLNSLADKYPHIVYYIGHAVQKVGQKVELVIGGPGAPAGYDVEKFRSLLHQIGPPRLLFLNSCAAAIGYELNPYLGAALSCAEQIDAVVAMQTMVPVEAAMIFATEFFRGLATGSGMAKAIKRGRVALLKQEPYRRGTRPAFTPYIPVLVQRTSQDNILRVDITKRQLQYILLVLQQYIERVDPYLSRAHDEALSKLLEAPVPQRRVSLVRGPRGGGKSTSIRWALLKLIGEERFREGERYLYYETREDFLVAGDEDRQINFLFNSVADRFSFLISGLKKRLKDCAETRPEDTLATVASWIEEEARDGRRYCVCLDNLPPSLASTIAIRASRVMKAGLLVLVTQDPELPPDLPIHEVYIPLMTDAEIRDAMRDQTYPYISDAEIQTFIEFSGRFPYFVAAYLRRRVRPSALSGDLAKVFIESYQQEISDEKMEILYFVALSGIPLPWPLLQANYSVEAIKALIDEAYLLLKIGDDCYRIPEALREYLRSTIPLSIQIPLHEKAFNGFAGLADAKESSQEETTFQLATQWYRQAFEHALRITQLDSEDHDQSLDDLEKTRGIAEILHDRYLEQGDDVGAAKSLWEDYRNVALSLGHYDDRSSDTHYADCLMRVGEYNTAEELLDQVIFEDNVDRIQLAALFLYSNLIKDRGRSGEFSRRIQLLQRALKVAHDLEGMEANRRWLKQQVASLEHALGNALSYGREAKPAEALRHLERAEKLFEELDDPLQLRTACERVEVKRYNEPLSPQEREEATKILLDNVRSLVTRAMRYDAILHFYELGRLTLDPAQRSKYFQWAFERAGDLYQPLNWHAAIHSRIAQVEATPVAFEEVAPALEEIVSKLEFWRTRAWSRRVLRMAWLFLTENYEKFGKGEKALTTAKKCWQVVEEIAEYGDGRKDPAERLKVARLYGRLAVRQKLEEAREVAAKVAEELGADPGMVSSMSEAELERLFSREIRKENV